MSVRARFYIQGVNLQAGDTAIANLSAVSRGKENSEWSQFTPSGNLSLSLTRKAGGAKQFFLDNIGKDVYLDVSLVESLDLCTECGEGIPSGYDDRELIGTGVHLGNDQETGGYAPGEFVHQKCVESAKARLTA